jgi:hypothetical protein
VTEPATHIPHNGRERLVFISADGTWHEPADDDTHLPAREAAVLLALLHLAVEKRYAYDFKTKCMLPTPDNDTVEI